MVKADGSVSIVFPDTPPVQHKAIAAEDAETPPTAAPIRPKPARHAEVTRAEPRPAAALDGCQRPRGCGHDRDRESGSEDGAALRAARIPCQVHPENAQAEPVQPRLHPEIPC